MFFYWCYILLNSCTMSFTESLNCMASFKSDINISNMNQYDLNFARELLNKINSDDTYLKKNVKSLISKIDSDENSNFSDKLYTLLRIILKKSTIIINTIFLKTDQFQIFADGEDNDKGYKYDLIVQRPSLVLNNKNTKILVLVYKGIDCKNVDYSKIKLNKNSSFDQLHRQKNMNNKKEFNEILNKKVFDYDIIYRCNKNINFIMNQSSVQPTIYRNTNDDRHDPFIDDEFSFIMQNIISITVSSDSKAEIKYNDMKYSKLIIVGLSYGGIVVNTLANKIHKYYQNIPSISNLCKNSIQIYTFGTIFKTVNIQENVMKFYEKYINYMYYNDISALHMNKSQQNTDLAKKLKDKVFTDEMWYHDTDNNLVWLIDRIDKDFNISKLNPVKYLKKNMDCEP